MAITSSAKKAAKRSLKNYESNLIVKLAMKKVVKDYLKALEWWEKFSWLLPSVYSVIDKAVKQWIIKKQTAARKKSRLTKKVK